MTLSLALMYSNSASGRSLPASPVLRDTFNIFCRQSTRANSINIGLYTENSARVEEDKLCVCVCGHINLVSNG